MPVTREYLEGQLADLSKQSEQALIALHNISGAMSTIKHLLSVLEAEEAPAGASTETEEAGCRE
jgi:hypothetical protein